MKYLSLPGASGTEGQWEMSGTVFINEYFYVTDHASASLNAGLGNNRLTVRNNSGDAVIVSKTDYYPFGSVASEWTSASPDIGKFKYQQKERDIETGYDYVEARLLDTQIGRFLQVDPMVEIQEYINVYHYALNNPILHNDPTGKCPPLIWAAGVTIYELGAALLTGAAVTYVTTTQKEKLENIGQGITNTVSETVNSTAASGAFATSNPLQVNLSGTAYYYNGSQTSQTSETTENQEASLDPNSDGSSPVGKDFIVTEEGTAVPLSQERMRDGFKKAEIPRREAEKTEPGDIYTVKTPNGLLMLE